MVIEEDDRCQAWVGLEPPEWFDCYLPKAHEGMHKGICIGYVRIGGEYKPTKVFIEWDSEILWQPPITPQEWGQDGD